MNKYDVIEFAFVNQDQLNERDIWLIADQFTTQEALDLSAMIWSNNTGNLGADTVIQIQGIHEFYKDNRFITDRQRRWLILAVMANWDRLDLITRSELIL